jgi:hypothetical protein
MYKDLKPYTLAGWIHSGEEEDYPPTSGVKQLQFVIECMYIIVM